MAHLTHHCLAMRASQLLQLSVFLEGLCLVCATAPPPGRVTAVSGRDVPMTGMVHMLERVQDNSAPLGVHRDQASVEPGGLQAGRTHMQVRKEPQVLSTKGGLRGRMVQDLTLGLGDLVREQSALESRMSHVLHRVAGPLAGVGTEINVSLLKVMMDKQARRLANLAAEITARDRRINRHQQQVEHLDKQVSPKGPSSFGA